MIFLKNKMSRALSLLIAAILILSTWSFVGEARRILQQPINSWTEDVNADCAVVLTGGPHRIREGVDLLVRHRVQKLIISGVHPQSSFKDIFPLWMFYGNLREQDVVLERRSQTTFGNAQQSLPLVEALRCHDLVLVTSRTHMRRALATFRAEFPSGLNIIPRAIAGTSIEPSWFELINETGKTLFYSLWAF